jgi:predicted transporter
VLGLTGLATLTYNYTEFVDLPGDPVAVPEPGILGLLIAGLLAMSGRRRLRAAARR